MAPCQNWVATGALLDSTFGLVDSDNNTFSVSRAQLVYALTLPLAALLGFLLAEPFGSNLVVVMVLVAALLMPLMMRCYHPLLVFTWNAAMIFPFLPGQPPWWMLVTAMGFLIIVLNRCIGSTVPLMRGGSVSKSLLWIAIVVAGTAILTGGAGLRTLGGTSFGGKRYVYIVAAILGYFVLTSQRTPPHRAMLYTVLFFLAATTAGLSSVAAGWLPMLGHIVPIYPEVFGEHGGAGMVRLAGMGAFSGALCYVFLARYGMRGLLDFTRPWRICLMAGFVAVGLFSGFRSSLLAQILTFGIVFFLEGLHRSRYLWWLLAGLLLFGVAMAKFSMNLPLSVQRSISFLPVEINPVARMDAQASVDWRVEMWTAALPDLREHLLLGKGYLLQPDDLYMAGLNASSGFGLASEGSAVAGDYHNGPLSLLIPFGIWGGMAFLFFLVASLRLMYRYCTLGLPELRTINRILFACFLTRTLFFLFVVGGFHVDLVYLVGLVGLAVSLNGEASSPPPNAVAGEGVALDPDMEQA